MVHSFYDDSPQFATCYLFSAFALGFVPPKTGFCFLDVFSNAKAEVRSRDA
jgi:hypothetical protein